MNTQEFFKNKVVLITGASSGIGKEMGGKILEWGGSVVVTGRNEERLKNLEKAWSKFSDRILLLQSDTKSPASTVTVVERTISRFGRLNVLVCNAALSSYGEIDKMPDQVIHDMVDTNIKGPIFQIKAAAAELRKTRGSILLVSSLAAFSGIPEHGLYSLSKMALTSLAQVLRVELSDAPVKVGIAYVCFTENESNKRTLNIKGEEEKVPQRNKWFTSTRAQTASKLLKQIADGKRTSIHSALGQLHAFLVKFTPGLVGFLAGRIYKKKKKQTKIP